ncbi:hypothetical protein Scep_010359 [Stephania cephalantha]|uniref:Uncharacterized protein n=1 Tax=Stephania cephalantha TaxID=152367 RepID=A0AAP0PD93_9MAGN
MLLSINKSATVLHQTVCLTRLTQKQQFSDRFVTKHCDRIVCCHRSVADFFRHTFLAKISDRLDYVADLSQISDRGSAKDIICRKQKRSKNENPSSSSLLCANRLRNPLHHRCTIIASTIATTAAVVGHYHRLRRPRLRHLSPSSALHADIIDTASRSAAALLLRHRCSHLPPPLLASSATPRIIVASTIATIVDVVVGHCYKTTRDLSPPPLSFRDSARCSHADAIGPSVAPPLLSSSSAAACLLRRRCSPPPPPLITSFAAAACLILDSAAGLLIRDSVSYTTRTPTPPSAELHPGGLARRHSKLVECLATRPWTFESQSQPHVIPIPINHRRSTRGTVYTPEHGASPSASHHDTPSPPVHALPAQHGTIPSSSHHSTPSPPGYVYPHEHGIRPSSSHHATPSPSAHPTHSPGVGDKHTSTSRRPPAPHRTSSARSSTSRLRSSIPPAIEEIADIFRPPTAPTESENPLIHLIAEHGLLHPSSVAAGKMSLVFNSGYLKEGWKWEYVFFTWDLQMSFAIYDAWCRKAAIRYTGNIYLIAKKRITPIYLTHEVFEHYKRMRATDEAFKKKSEQMSTNRKSEVGGPGTGISLHSAGSISARQHGDTMEKKLKRRPTRKEMFRHLHTHGHDDQTFVDQRSAKIDVTELTQRLEEMSTQTPDTSIDEDAIYLEVVLEVKGCVYGLGSQGYHRSISLGEASSSRGPAYGPHELEELQRDHQRLQETLLNERMERQEQMQRDKMERQEENREMQDRLAHMEALLMQHLGIRPHVPPTPRTPLSPVTERSGP